MVEHRVGAWSNDEVLTGREITLEIGGRTLLRDGSFVVGAGEKVALVGANGAGKSSLLAFLLGDTPGHLHASGDVALVGTVGFLPQVPTPEGLGVDSSVLSHVLSARGLDVLDDEMHAARRAVSESPTPERIERFSALEERYRRAGGYEVEARLARLAHGLGLPEGVLLAEVGSLSGGHAAGWTSSGCCSRSPTSWCSTSRPTTSTARPSCG